MTNIFEQALSIASPQYIKSIEFNNDKLDIFLDFHKGSTFADIHLVNENA